MPTPPRTLALLALSLLLACEKVSRRPVVADAAPRRPPDAAVPDAPSPPPDAPPPAPDARPGPRHPRELDRFDACETDADCTVYGDPCGAGLIPVNTRYKEQARARAQRRCPGESMMYLSAKRDLEAVCRDGRCRDPDAIILGPGR